jgi:hypothetical protein
MARAKPTHAVYTMYLKPMHKLPHPFPIDMLRRDNCVPHTETDANRIAATQRHEVDAVEGLVIAVDRFYLVGGNPAPTRGRWESFGWTFLTEGEVYALTGNPQAHYHVI